MLTYPIDLNEPYKVLSSNEDGSYTVLGTAKTLQAHISEKIVEFGGHQCIFTLMKEDFLTKAMKRQLKWVQRKLGDRQHDVELNKLYDSVIAGHNYKNT
jgi:hypothetical protein